MNIDETRKIICLSKLKGKYITFISDGTHEYPLYIDLHENSLKHAKLRCSWKLKIILKDYLYMVKQRLECSSSVESFVMELQVILSKEMKSLPVMNHLFAPDFYSTLIDQLNTLGWDRIANLDDDMYGIQIKFNDLKERIHILGLTFSSQFPKVAPKMYHELPLDFNFAWHEKSVLSELCEAFSTSLNDHQTVWNHLDEVDSSCWVLEPDKPKYNDCSRRIFLGNNSSLLLKINPIYPSALPECRFLGSSKVIDGLQAKLNNGLDLWNAKNSVLENLKNILDFEFPKQSAQNNEDFVVECGICYCYHHNDMIPDNMCNGPCGKPFHSICLYEWLRSIPNSRQSYHTIFGECLYCGTSITCKMPSSIK